MDYELYHHGVKGMKWGVRKKRETPTSDIRKRYDAAKEDVKSSKKAYNKAYSKAHNYSARHPIGQFISKKKSTESDKRWNDAINKADKLNTAKSAYKQAKSDRKTAIENAYRDINKQTKIGAKILYNNATRKAAAKYVVDNNMSIQDATKRANSEAKRNTAILVGAFGAYTVASLMINK